MFPEVELFANDALVEAYALRCLFGFAHHTREGRFGRTVTLFSPAIFFLVILEDVTEPTQRVGVSKNVRGRVVLSRRFVSLNG